MSDITIYIPVYNRADWCKKLEVAPGVSYVASDNGSTDGTPDILESLGIHVVRQTKSLGRTGNWAFCVEHFRRSKSEWMKFLFAGDQLASDCANLVRAAATDHPRADLLLFGFEVIENDQKTTCRPAETPTEFTNIEALVRAATAPNWFGALIGTVIHRRALRNPVNFSTLDWAGDFYFATSLARHCTMVGLPDLIGTFVAEHRKHYGILRSSLQAFLEESYVQEFAIRELEALGYEQCSALRTDLTGRLALFSTSWLQKQQGSDRYGREIAQSLHTKTLSQVLLKRLWSKLRQ